MPFPTTCVRGLRRCRCLIPRLARWLAASRRVDVVPAFDNNEDSDDTYLFGAQSRGLNARCLRFATFLSPQGLYGYARLASGWWPAFAGRGYLPQGCE